MSWWLFWFIPTFAHIILGLKRFMKVFYFLALLNMSVLWRVWGEWFKGKKIWIMMFAPGVHMMCEKNVMIKYLSYYNVIFTRYKYILYIIII